MNFNSSRLATIVSLLALPHWAIHRRTQAYMRLRRDSDHRYIDSGYCLDRWVRNEESI